jgi:hypothetical protein
VQGLRIAEIGEALELTTEQVEQALFAARNRLAEQLTFGRRLDCEAVQVLEPDTLDLTARRALKSHVRSCPSCRSARRARSAGLGALGPLSALRDALAWLGGGGAVPAAAKLGAVAATAAVAVAGAPVVVPHGTRDARQPVRVPVAVVAVRGPAEAAVFDRRPAARVELRRTRAPAPPNPSSIPAAHVRRVATPAAPAPERPSPDPARDAAPAPGEPAPGAEEPPAEEPAPTEPEEAASAPASEPEPPAGEPALEPVEEPKPEREAAAADVSALQLEATPGPEPEAQPEPARASAQDAAPRSSDLAVADQDSAPAPTLSR